MAASRIRIDDRAVQKHLSNLARQQVPYATALATMGALKLLIRFGSAVEVTKRLSFHDRAKALVGAEMGAAFGRALARALKTAR
jgi:hypothetical protein